MAMLKKIVFLLLPSFISLSMITANATEVQDYLSQGMKLAKEKKYEEAIGKYEEALKINPKDMGALLLAGLTHAQIGKLDRAIEYTKKASEIGPSYTPFYHLGLLYAVHNEPEKAIRSFDQALTFNPESYVAEYQKGLVYASQRSYREAMEAYQRAIELNPASDDARLALAAVSYQQGNTAEAERQAEELRKLKREAIAKALEEWIEERNSKTVS